MSSRKAVLGKGLASLLPNIRTEPPPPPIEAQVGVENQVQEKESEASSPAAIPPNFDGAHPEAAAGKIENKDRHPGISLAAIEEIVENPYQPRKDFKEEEIEELSQSILANGIIQPLVVRKVEKGYELIAGERRLRAAKRIQLKRVPIVIRKSTDRESLELALVENIQRSNLNCIDEAMAYFQLQEEFSLKQEEIAKRVGKERASVANFLRLLRLPEEIRDALRSQQISFGHGKALLGLEDSEARLRLFREILEKKLSVRATEDRITLLKEGSDLSKADEKTPAETPVVSRLKNLSQELTRSWSAKVQIRGNDQKGKILIHYGSRQELDRILSGMQNESIWPDQQT